MTFKLPHHIANSDGSITLLADLSNETLAGIIVDIRASGYISYVEWRAAGRNLMETGTCTDEQFDAWVQRGVTVTIDAVEAELQRRAEQPAITHGTRLSVVK
jgi:hypothetical protein